MLALLITGPNCSGKSTAADLALRPWAADPRLVVAHGDADGTYKGNPAAQQAAVQALWDSAAPVVVIEGTQRLATAVGLVAGRNRGRRFVALITTQAPDVMRAHLQARCAKAGKTFRADYWTDKVLQYEGQLRFRNLAPRMFPDARFFPIGPAYEGQDALEREIARQAGTAL